MPQGAEGLWTGVGEGERSCCPSEPSSPVSSHHRLVQQLRRELKGKIGFMGQDAGQC